MADDFRDNVPGVIYLLHFDRPLGDPTRPCMSARHYMGWANLGQLQARLGWHRRGKGSAIIKALINAGGDFEVVRVHYGTRNDERRLKNTGHFADRLCGLCKGERNGKA